MERVIEEKVRSKRERDRGGESVKSQGKRELEKRRRADRGREGRVKD